MTRVMAAGVFDLLHLGHLHYLREARAVGDELVVVVATDASARQRKRPPILPEDVRAELVGALRPVDEAVVGHESDHFKTVERVDPDVIAIGYDDHHEVADLEAQLEERGLGHVRVERMGGLDHEVDSTRTILRRILAMAERGEIQVTADPDEEADA